jgi:hypothetical protein
MWSAALSSKLPGCMDLTSLTKYELGKLELPLPVPSFRNLRYMIHILKERMNSQVSCLTNWVFWIKSFLVQALLA